MAKVKISDLDVAATLDGTELVELEQGGTSVKCTTQDIADLGGGGYLKYVALLSQSGTSAPTATVLENTLGGTVVWSYNGNGSYDATLTAAFTADKTVVFIGGPGSSTGFHTAYRDDDNMVTVQTFDSGSPANDMLAETPIEIRVYP